MKSIRSRCLLAAAAAFSVAQAPLHAAPPAGVPPQSEVIVTNPETQPVPVTGQVEITAKPAVTHMGQAAADHVELGLGSGGALTCPTGTLSTIRQLPDGGVGFGEFVVPEGRSLVLTDFEVSVAEATGLPWSAGSFVTVHVLAGAPGSSSLRTIWRDTVLLDGSLAAARQTMIRSALTSGVVLAAGQRVCIGAGFGLTGSGTNGTVTVFNIGRLYGYLVDG